MISDRSAQHRVHRLNSIEYRTLRDRFLYFNLYFMADMRQRPQMLWKFDPDHSLHKQTQVAVSLYRVFTVAVRRIPHHRPEISLLLGCPVLAV